MTRLVVERRPMTDLLQQRYAVLKTEQRRIVAELRDVVRQIRIGHCEVCGKEFTRQRPTKRYCSMRCCQLAAPSSSGQIDLGLIRAHWPLLEASGLMNPEPLRVLRALVSDNETYDGAAIIGAVSRQRVHQIAQRATQHMRIVLAVRDAVVRQQQVPTGSASPKGTA